MKTSGARLLAVAFAGFVVLGAASFVAFSARAQEHPAPHGQARPEHTGTAGGGANAHGEAREHAAGHGPADLNIADIGDRTRPAILALVINFGLLIGLYYVLGKKPIAEALRQRRTTIVKDIEDAQKVHDEAKERAKKYQSDLKNVDTDAATAKATLIAAGKGEVERVLLEAEEKSERMKRDADRLIEQERKQTRDDLLHQTVDLAVARANDILERSVTAEDHARFAHDLLAELAAKPAARRSAS